MFIIAVYSKATEELTLTQDESFPQLLMKTVLELRDQRLIIAITEMSRKKRLDLNSFMSIMNHFEYVVTIREVK